MRRALWFCTLLAVCCWCKVSAASVRLGDRFNGRPVCSNQEMTDMVREKIRDYNLSQTDNSIREVRRRNLLLKNLQSFVPVSPAGFTAEDDWRTANRLITLKINEGYEDSDFTLCQSAGSGAAYHIYLLIYRPKGAPFSTVEIINFLPPEKSGDVFSVFY